MLQTLLNDRFKLKLHRETKSVRGYALVIAKDRSKLNEAKTDEPSLGFEARPGRLVVKNKPISTLVKFLSISLGTQVLDKTNLTGGYDINLNWTPEIGDRPSEPLIPALPNNGPSLSTALQEQLGLRLKSEKTKMEVLIIDQAERATNYE